MRSLRGLTSAEGATPRELARVMILVMLALWLVGQILELSSGYFSSSLVDSMSFYPNSYQIRHQPWGIISYPWWHYDLLSLGANVLSLYALARLYPQRRTAGQAVHSGGKDSRDGSMAMGGVFLSTFVWGSLWGAVFYAVVAWLGSLMGLIHIFPLSGASAGVCALALRLAMSAPRRRVRVMGLRLNFLALILIIYILTTLLSGENLGGILAHLGGALYGLVLALWGEGDLWGRSGSNEVAQPRGREHAPSEQELISRKLCESGYKSLSPEEQDKL